MHAHGSRQRRGRKVETDGEGYQSLGDRRKRGRSRSREQRSTQRASVAGAAPTRLLRGDVALGPWSCGNCFAHDNWAERSKCRVCGREAPGKWLDAQSKVRAAKAKGDKHVGDPKDKQRIADLEALVKKQQQQHSDGGPQGEEEGRIPRPKPSNPIIPTPAEEAAAKVVEKAEEALRQAEQMERDHPGGFDGLVDRAKARLRDARAAHHSTRGPLLPYASGGAPSGAPARC